MKFKTLCAVVAGLTISAFSSGCSKEWVEYKGKVGDETVTRIYAQGFGDGCINLWRMISVQRPEGTQTRFYDDEANGSLNYIEEKDVQGNLIQTGLLGFDCVYMGNQRGVSNEQQREFERYLSATTLR